MNEFVVGRTAAYVSQTDNHLAELTVRETLDFASRVQGGGYGALSACYLFGEQSFRHKALLDLHYLRDNVQNWAVGTEEWLQGDEDL